MSIKAQTYLGMAIPALVFAFIASLIAIPAKAGNPEIRLYNNTAKVPMVQGGAMRLTGLEFPSFLDGIRRQSIVIQHFSNVMCNEMIIEFFDMDFGDTQTVVPQNGELCILYTEDRTFYGATPHWVATHTTDPTAIYHVEEDNVCFMITELWCQFY